MEKDKKLTEEQTGKTLEIIANIVDWGISGLAVVGGIILMILQVLDDSSYPHGLIAGTIVLGFGVIIFMTDRILYSIRKKWKYNQKKGIDNNGRQ